MLNKITNRIVTLIHGSTRSADGFLLTPTKYIDNDQESALGQSYLGLIGLIIFGTILLYILAAYGTFGGGRGGRYGVRFNAFSDMPIEIQFLLPIAIAAHLIAMISIFRIIVNWAAISSQHRSNIE